MAGILHRYGYGTIDNCRFVNCSAHYAYAVEIIEPIGGVHKVTNCEFINNTQNNINPNADFGAALTARSSGAIVENCTFINNSAITNGGL